MVNKYDGVRSAPISYKVRPALVMHVVAPVMQEVRPLPAAHNE